MGANGFVVTERATSRSQHRVPRKSAVSVEQRVHVRPHFSMQSLPDQDRMAPMLEASGPGTNYGCLRPCDQRNILFMHVPLDPFETAVAKARIGETPRNVFLLDREDVDTEALHNGEIVTVPAYPVPEVVDATGAGDLFASGFLLALSRGQDLQTALRLGCLSASEVISHIGARPVLDLEELAREHGLLGEAVA